MFIIAFDVVRDPVTLSCRTTLSGDSRAGANASESTEEPIFRLSVNKATVFGTFANLEDTTPGDRSHPQPGKYQLLGREHDRQVAQTTRPRKVEFLFGADAECHRVS